MKKLSGIIVVTLLTLLVWALATLPPAALSLADLPSGAAAQPVVLDLPRATAGGCA